MRYYRDFLYEICIVDSIEFTSFVHDLEMLPESAIKVPGKFLSRHFMSHRNLSLTPKTLSVFAGTDYYISLEH
jgi:hypothetical protein